MKNSKVIVINGLQRSGTNILYNIFQSHPSVCSIHNKETGEIISQLYRFKSHRAIFFLIRRLKMIFYNLLNKKVVLDSSLVYIFGKIIDWIFFQYKMQDLNDPYNRFKFENELYTKEDVKLSILCIKSIRWDIELTNFLSKIYTDIYFIGLVRNGYAVCESWMRREHKKPNEFGLMYKRYYEMMLNYSKSIKNFIIIKFEDIIEDPFHVASKLFEFANLDPKNLKKMRLNMKKRLTNNGSHKVKFGVENTKYWFNPQNIRQLIDPNINEIQIKHLTEFNKKIFETNAKPILKYFNYLR